MSGGKWISPNASPTHNTMKRDTESGVNEDESKEYSKRVSPVSDKPNSLENQKKRYRRNYRKRSKSPSPKCDEKGSPKHSVVNKIEACHCLGVFGLSSCTEERDLREVFSAYGEIDKLCLVFDRQSGHSKGFGFVYFKCTDDAIMARKETQGLVLDGRPIRVDYSYTLEPHSRTPDKYKGRQSYGYKSSRYYRYEHRRIFRPQHQSKSNFHDRYSRHRSGYNKYGDTYKRSTSRR